MNKTTVAIEKCTAYTPAMVRVAMDRMFENLGGLDKYLKPGMRVFIKPNLLMASTPDKACTTHPAIMIELIKKLQAFGCLVSFGDLPGSFYVVNTKKVHRETGMQMVARETGAKLVTLEKHGFKDVDVENAVRMPVIHIPRYLDEVDAMINVCKIKTHMQSRYTGAVKNLFGLVTTQDRLTAHKSSRYESFAEALVDIFSVFNPVLNIADAIVGMEGTGPSQGSPVKLNFIGASTDAVALDTVAACIMGFGPREIGTIEAARKKGIGASRMREIDVVGTDPDTLKTKVQRPSSAISTLLPLLSSPLAELTTVRPVIIKENCKKCKTCVAACPNDAIRTTGEYFEIDDGRCLKCFCCHELCPYDAVDLKKPFLVRIAEKIRF